MKFFGPTMSLCLASLAMAAPAPVAEVVPTVPAERRQGATVVGSVSQSIAVLLPILPVYEDAIHSAVVAILTSSASVEAAAVLAAEGVINTNLGAIATALNSTAAAIAAVTVDAAGGVAAAIGQLTQAEINQLQLDLVVAQNVVTGVGVVVTGTASLGGTSAAAAAAAVVGGELEALEQALQPFLGPIYALADAAVNAAGSASLTVYGLQNALQGLQTIAGNLFDSIGL